MYVYGLYVFFFFKSSGGWVKLKLMLPHFHVSDTRYMCFDLTHAPVVRLYVAMVVRNWDVGLLAGILFSGRVCSSLLRRGIIIKTHD